MSQPEAGSADPTADGEQALVIIPTYNEAHNLRRVISRTRAAVPRAALLVVDDASPDGTGELAERIAADEPAVHVLHREHKLGLGHAYLAGFAWGLARDHGVFVEMDADGSHQPEQLPALLAAIAAGADLALGARWVSGGQVTNWPRRRELLSRGANLYTRLALGLPLFDATSGFRAFRRRTLELIGLERVASQGYCFQIDLAWRAMVTRCRVVEVPITFYEREHGASKMSGRVVTEALWRVTAWGLGYRARQLQTLSGGRR